MESNRLLLLVDRSTLGGIYKRGIQDINANSYMANELVVRIGKITGQHNDDMVYENGVFKQSQLQPDESLWAYFAQDLGGGTHGPVYSFLLAERSMSQLTDTEEIDGVTTYCEEGNGKEYWIQLPQVVLQNPGTWDFSIALKHIATVATGLPVSKVQYMGRWDAKVEATQIVRIPEVGDAYGCAQDGGYAPDGSTGQTFTTTDYAVWSGSTWLKVNQLYRFDYVKTSSSANPFNLVVNASLAYNDGAELASGADVVALWEQIKSLATGQGVFGYVKNFTKLSWTYIDPDNTSAGAYLIVPKSESGIAVPYATDMLITTAVYDGGNGIVNSTNADFSYEQLSNGLKVTIHIDLSHYEQYNGKIYIKEMFTNG